MSTAKVSKRLVPGHNGTARWKVVKPAGGYTSETDYFGYRWDGKENHPIRTVGRNKVRQAVREHGMIAWQDLRDDMAVAQDGIDPYEGLPEWERELLQAIEQGVPGVQSLPLPNEMRYSTSTSMTKEVQRGRTFAQAVVVLDEQEQAKAKRRASIRQDMEVNGTRYPDLDPYTLEPIGAKGTPKGFIRVSRATATSRRNHANASSWGK